VEIRICNNPIFNITLLVLLLGDISIIIIVTSIGLFDITMKERNKATKENKGCREKRQRRQRYKSLG